MIIIMFYGYIVDVVAHCLKWPFKASLMVEFTQVIILCGFCNELQLKNTCRLILFFQWQVLSQGHFGHLSL